MPGGLDHFPVQEEKPLRERSLIVNIFLDNLNLVLTDLGIGAREGELRQQGQRRSYEYINESLHYIHHVQSQSLRDSP